MATDDDESEVYGERWGVHRYIRMLIEGESSRQSSSPNHPKQSIVSICMVPDTIRNLNPGAYTPRITSIGPLHNGDQRLRALEEIKVTYMYRLFCETVKSTNQDMKQTTDIIQCKCVNAVFGLIEQERAFYSSGPESHYHESEYFDPLAKMMVIDGCFILQLLHRSHEHGIGEGDPIFDNILVENDVKYDLLLLENQMPFCILEILFSLTVKQILRSSSLTDLILCFFKDMNFLDNGELTLENGIVEHCHILGLLHSCYRPGGSNRGGVPTIRYSATEIAGAGVTFKPQVQRNRDSLLAVQFLQSLVPGFGKLFIREASFVIPVLRIEDSTPSFLRNLIAYEQSNPLSCHYVASFALLMNGLIDTKNDVSLLVRANVLQHKLGSSEDVANLFNSICNGVVRRDFYYSDEWAKLDAYCNRFWPSILISLVRIFLSLRRLYTSTTWKTLAVIGAVAIFVLTLIQTIYAVRNA